MNENENIICPYCGEEINAKASKCKNCKTSISEEDKLLTSIDSKAPITSSIKKKRSPLLMIVSIVLMLAVLVTAVLFALNNNDPVSLTENDVINTFIGAGLPIGDVFVYTEETCPNNLLGRPGQYIGKASWVDTRIEQFSDEPQGGTVEVFSNEKDLNTRKEYLTAIIENPLFAQYMFEHLNVLVRIDSELTPTQADKYREILYSIINREDIGRNSASRENIESQTDTPQVSTPAVSDKNGAIELKHQNYNVWERRDNIYAHYDLEIVNNSNKTIEIEWPITVSLVGSDDSIIYSDTPEAFPNILLPGEVAYAGGGTILDHINDKNEVVGMEVNLNYNETTRKNSNLELESLKFFIERSSIRVTGRVVNILDKDIDSTRIKVALYDAENNLLGTIFGYTSGTIPPGSNLGFDTSSVFIDVDAIKDKVYRVDGRAYVLN